LVVLHNEIGRREAADLFMGEAFELFSRLRFSTIAVGDVCETVRLCD
jgi:hypothetical protein